MKKNAEKIKSTNNVHDDLYGFAGDKNAAFVGSKTLAFLALDSLKKNGALATKYAFELEAHKPFGVKVVKFETKNSGAVSEIQAYLNKYNEKQYLYVDEGLVITAQLGEYHNGQIRNPITSVSLELNNLRFQLETESNRILVLPGEATFETPDFTRLIEAEELKLLIGSMNASSGRAAGDPNNPLIDETYISRIEGAMGFSVIQDSIMHHVSKQYEIYFADLFPGSTFEGPVETAVGGHTETSYGGFDSPTCLMLKPGKLTNGTTVCSGTCADFGDGVGDSIPGTTTVTNETGEVTLGGITGVNLRDVELGRRTNGIGDIGIYIPKNVVADFGDGVYPSVTLKTSNNGMIGYDAWVTVMLQKLQTDIDQTNGGIRLTLELELHGSGILTFDLGPYGRPKIGEFMVRHTDVNSKEIIINLLPVLKNGVVYLKPVIERMPRPHFEVDLTFFSVIGGAFGKVGSMVGFIIDYILASMIEVELPNAIRDKLYEYMADASWKLVDVDQWTKVSGWRPRSEPFTGRLTAYYHEKDGTFLVSGSNGE